MLSPHDGSSLAHASFMSATTPRKPESNAIRSISCHGARFKTLIPVRPCPLARIRPRFVAPTSPRPRRRLRRTIPAVDHAFAAFRLPDGRSRTLAPGELVGRLWSAGLQTDDPRVSEGHALLSLRGGELWLLALRRRLALTAWDTAQVQAGDAPPVVFGGVQARILSELAALGDPASSPARSGSTKRARGRCASAGTSTSGGSAGACARAASTTTVSA